MEYLQLDVIKKQLNLDSDFTDDDNYLISLATAAEQATEIYIDIPLESLEDSSGDIPRSLKQAILLLIGNWYATREAVGSTSLNTVPLAYDFLCDLARNYSLDKSL